MPRHESIRKTFHGKDEDFKKIRNFISPISNPFPFAATMTRTIPHFLLQLPPTLISLRSLVNSLHTSHSPILKYLDLQFDFKKLSQHLSQLEDSSHGFVEDDDDGEQSTDGGDCCCTVVRGCGCISCDGEEEGSKGSMKKYMFMCYLSGSPVPSPSRVRED